VRNSAPEEIPLERIKPNPHQPRRSFNETTLRELAESIRHSGLIQPVVVRMVKGGYELVAGERRWRAAALAGLATIPIILREADELLQAELALIENIQREDLNPIDRAQAYRTLMNKLHVTQAELATRLGEDRSSIANYLRLLDLGEPVRDQVRDGSLSMGHAKILAGIDDPAEQERLAKLVQVGQLSVRALEKLIQEAPTEKTPPKAKPMSAHLQELEQSIARQLGMRVQLRTGSQKGKGRLVIHYHSLDQFDDLVQRLGISTE
jgi:ParB family chromosome partitioning protein